MTPEIESVVAEALDGFVPLGEDAPQVQDFASAVADHIATRPSPTPPSETFEQRVIAKLDEIIALLSEGGRNG